MIHLRLVLPPDVAGTALDYLSNDPRVTNLVVLPGAGIRPPGDAVLCDVAREAASDIIGRLAALGVADRGGITLQEVSAAPSKGAELAEQVAPGAPDDAIIWDAVLDRAEDDAASSWAYYTFFALATVIAAIAIITDSAILVVGAMVVGPEFGPVSALAVGLVLRRLSLARHSAWLLLSGYAGAIAITVIVALLASLAGWIDAADLERPRPATQFIWSPDRWSFVVALLAGAAGVLSLTAGKGSALVGVFISVTTVPAAGNLALALALWVPGEIVGSMTQLALNLSGMVLAGCAVLGLQRFVTRAPDARERSRQGDQRPRGPATPRPPLP